MTNNQKEHCLHHTLYQRITTHKTALIVRYLTKKFLHEYIRGELLTYDRRVTVDDKEFSLFFIDTPGTNTLANLEKQEIMENVDGYVIVYSITDRKSFMTSKEMLRSLHHGFEIVGHSPVCLIGNKLDLNHMTKVTQEEGESVSKFYPNVEFRECSAAEGVKSVEFAFNEFLKTVARSKDSKKHMNSNSLTVSKSPSPRRHSAGNSALSHWWRRPRSSSACEHNRQDRTYTM
ncbi:Ras-related and estrogen-regulated growth inhibitor-like protein [Araneus ventricosus]|uniref:small monomeric GTPase n=1 Tax=Araneus ventricosus TaxID=182803 RepID=A0A4Y2AI63_ARAVE|nr:Ras-related and estrogen-regulated growth inhibitor-like protein [Araneus ventricosus]